MEFGDQDSLHDMRPYRVALKPGDIDVTWHGSTTTWTSGPRPARALTKSGEVLHKTLKSSADMVC